MRRQRDPQNPHCSGNTLTATTSSTTVRLEELPTGLLYERFRDKGRLDEEGCDSKREWRTDDAFKVGVREGVFKFPRVAALAYTAPNPLTSFFSPSGSDTLFFRTSYYFLSSSKPPRFIPYTLSPSAVYRTHTRRRSLHSREVQLDRHPSLGDRQAFCFFSGRHPSPW